jgi:ribosomal protein RSM22 (predicted rRNA methylase)
LLSRARCVLWVEPGTHEVSRALAGWREQLRGTGAQVIAPCTHHAACGLLAAGNERHWCHFFASPPPEIFADSNWVKFGQRAGIDLRSLPYSFLVLANPTLTAATAPQRDEAGAGDSRILGEPRVYKGYAKLFNCSAAGVEELTLQQRVDKPFFKSLKRVRGPLLYRWTRDGLQITAAEPLFAPEAPPTGSAEIPDSGTG